MANLINAELQQGHAAFTPYLDRRGRPPLVPADFHADVDALHRKLEQLPPALTTLAHRFTPGLYSREFFMPRGSAVISHVHKTEHQFCVLKGRALVWTDSGFQDIVGPHIGVTKPGTRRVLYIVDDCTWVTFHPTKETDLNKLEAELIEKVDVKQAAGNPATMDLLTRMRRHVLAEKL